MFYHVNCAQAIQGKIREAVAAANQLAAYVNEQYEGITVEILRDLSGRPNRIYWVERFASMAAWEEYRKRERNDPEFRKLESSVFQLVDYDNSESRFYRVVSGQA